MKIPGQELRVTQDAGQVVDVGWHTKEHQFLERSGELGRRGCAIRAKRHEFREHRIECRGNRLPGNNSAVEAHAGARGNLKDAHPPRRRAKVVLRLLGADADLDGMAAGTELGLRERKPGARGDAQLLGHKIKPEHAFGHRMLHLQSGVHLKEIEHAPSGASTNSTVPALR